MPDSPRDPRIHRRPPKNAFEIVYPPTPSQQRRIWLKKHRTDVASTLASLTATAVCYPLDTIKTRIQGSDEKPIRQFATAKGSRFNLPTIACAKAIYNEEGLRGFWRGVFTPLFSITLHRWASFYVYQKAKYHVDEQMFAATGQSPLVIANTPYARPGWSTNTCFAVSGAVAGFCASFISAPFEITKVARQLSTELVKNKSGGPVNKTDEEIRRSYYKKSSTATALALLKNRGPLGLYTGFRYHVVRDTIGTSLWYGSYEAVKMRFGVSRGKSSMDDLSIAIAGFASGVISMTLLYPLDTVKTTYQKNCLMHHQDRTEYPKVNFFKRSEYRAWPINLLRSGTTNLILFLIFEKVKKRINDIEI